MIFLKPKPIQSFFVYRIQSKGKIYFSEKELFKEKGEKRKEGFLTTFATGIRKDPTESLRNQANELKSCEDSN